MLRGPLTPSTRVQPKPHLGNPHMGIANSEIKQVFVLGTWHFLKWDARGLIVPLLVPCREISARFSRELDLDAERERCIHGFLMLAMISCLFLSCSATDFLHSTSDTAEEQLGNQ